MYGGVSLEHILLGVELRFRECTLRKLIEERGISSLHAKMVDTELERRGILDKLKRRKPEWFI
jgi:hypothetical protein